MNISRRVKGLGCKHFNRSGISKLPCAITQYFLPPTHDTDVKMVSLDQDQLISFKFSVVLGFFSKTRYQWKIRVFP